ncbi:hypothetical protein OZX69_03730 [Lactobacillus sp. ESL0731]|uniref:hypothetical protein n=1 Tax=unclassified Lactobacillus TaxID=2620435 RepID=UPI0023F9AAC2|nr:MULTISPECIES: hypothetical protein [unclassified Lactobacillus]WEV51820.1 hypothetical protein OZX63_03730 [Lactobacillus sp. ESL0700]WEV62949.1 hypothetical protein OZX69_03730 [Lactobacillus sp. ESL0731]
MNKKDLRKRMLWTLLLVTVYILGQFIIIPFVKQGVAARYLKANTLISILGMYTGAQTSRPALLMLGIGPYMTTNIMVQAVSSLDLQSLRQVSQHTWGIVTNLLSLVVAILQAFLYVSNFKQALMPLYIGDYNVSYYLAILILVTGGMISIYLANIISERGIGNSAILMVPQLVMSMPSLLTRGWGTNRFSFSIINIVIVVVTTLVVVFYGLALIRAEERIPLREPELMSDFAKSYFPIRLLTAGAMPFMFSTSMFMLLPMLAKSSPLAVRKFVSNMVAIDKPAGIVFYAIVIVLLNFVFGLITLQPSVKARNFKENGSYFYKIVPGMETEKFIMGKFNRLTWVSSLILIVLSIWPLILGLKWPEIANLTPFIGNLFILIMILDMVEQEFQTLNSEKQYVIDLK